MSNLFYNARVYTSFLDVIKIFQTYNNGLLKEPFIIEKILNKDKIIYSQKEISRKFFTQKSLEKIQQNLKHYKENSFGAFENQLNNTKNLFFLDSVAWIIL